MLSSMETPMGVMVIGPNGQSIRVQRSNAAFTACRDLLRKALPAEQVWHELQMLMADPLKALLAWCERYGMTLKEDGTELRLDDLRLMSAKWLPLLNRLQAASASPVLAMRLASMLGDGAASANVGGLCLHHNQNLLGELSAGVVALRSLPTDARVGDLVNTSSRGTVEFLVSYNSAHVQEDGSLELIDGTVLARARDVEMLDDVLSQPAILGYDRTYRCEEGGADGWLEDMSFDSLKAARQNAKEIQASGSEARIINRITGEPVSLL